MRDCQLPKKNSDTTGNVIHFPEHELLNRDVMYIARAKCLFIGYLKKGISISKKAHHISVTKNRHKMNKKTNAVYSEKLTGSSKHILTVK